MSIATLKKRYYASHNLSRNAPFGFSLNSSRRLEGHHQEPQIQTLFRGPVPRGTGNATSIITINKSQRVNYDPFNKPRPSIKSNQALLSKMMWLKPIVKEVSATTYGNYYVTINSNNTVNKTGGTCNTGYTKDLSLPSYELYQETTLLKKNCIPMPPSMQHQPIAGNGAPCGQNPVSEPKC